MALSVHGCGGAVPASRQNVRRRRPLPRALHLEEAQAKEEAWAREDDESLPPTYFGQHIYLESHKSWQIRKEWAGIFVSQRPLVVAQLDAIVVEVDLTRSGAIAVAAHDYAERLRAGHRH